MLAYSPRFYNRIRGKAVRGEDGSLFWRKRSKRPCGQNTKGLSLCFSEFNYIGYEKKRLETEHWTGETQGTWNVLCTVREVDAVSAFSSSTTQDTRANGQDWNTGPKRRKGRETFSVRFGKWTSVLWARVQLQRIRDIASGNGSLDRNIESGWNSRADISGNARHFCDGEFNYKGYETSRLKIILLKAWQYLRKRELTVFVSSLFQLNCSRKIPYMVFLLIDFHASNNLFYIENVGNPSFLL